MVTVDALSSQSGKNGKFLTTNGTTASWADVTLSSIASNKVTAMTDYSKPTSTSAISASDSLNTAIDKLEKALDGKQDSDSYLTTHQTIKNHRVTDSNINTFALA